MGKYSVIIINNMRGNMIFIFLFFSYFNVTKIQNNALNVWHIALIIGSG